MESFKLFRGKHLTRDTTAKPLHTQALNQTLIVEHYRTLSVGRARWIATTWMHFIFSFKTNPERNMSYIFTMISDNNTHFYVVTFGIYTYETVNRVTVTSESMLQRCWDSKFCACFTVSCLAITVYISWLAERIAKSGGKNCFSTYNRQKGTACYCTFNQVPHDFWVHKITAVLYNCLVLWPSCWFYTQTSKLSLAPLNFQVKSAVILNKW